MKTPEPAQIDNELRVLELRRTGMTFTAIAQVLGYADHSGAIYAYKNAMKRVLKEPAEAIRDLEVARLDELLTVAYNQALEGDLQALTVALKIMDRRARLLGLDAPTTVKQEVTTWDGGDTIDRAVRDLATLLTRNDENSGIENTMDSTGSQTESATS
jgi:hypothetical protein